MINRARISSMIALLALIMLTTLTFHSTQKVEADHKLESWPHTPGQLLELDVGVNLTPRFAEHLPGVLADLSDPRFGNPVRLTAVPGAGKNDGECPHVVGRIEICNLNLGETGGNGFLVIDFDENGFMLAAVAIINDFYFPGPPWEDELIHTEDRILILCHELGHAIGLDHQDESGKSLGTCMDYSGDAYRLNAHDYIQLARQYGAKLHVINVGGVRTAGTSVVIASSEAQKADEDHEREKRVEKPNEYGGVTVTITLPELKR